MSVKRGKTKRKIETQGDRLEKMDEKEDSIIHSRYSTVTDCDSMSVKEGKIKRKIETQEGRLKKMDGKEDNIVHAEI